MIKFFKRIMNKLFSRTQKYSYCSNCNKQVYHQKTCPFCTTKTIEIIERSDYFEIKNPYGNNFMIEKSPSKEAMFTWDAAGEYAQKLNNGGFSGWRLPTLEELKIIYQVKSICRINYDVWLWSSETSKNNPNEATCLSLANGKICDDPKSDSRIYVCCVK